MRRLLVLGLLCLSAALHAQTPNPAHTALYRAKQLPEMVPVIGAGEILIALAFVPRDDLVDVDRASHAFHVRHDEHSEPGLMRDLLVAERSG